MTKVRSRKNNIKQRKGTLDQKHTEHVNKFEKINSSLPTKKEKLIRMENKLKDLMEKNPNKYTHEDIRQKAYLMDTIDKLREEITSIENCTDSLNYIVNTLPILIDYYDNTDIVDDEIEEEYIYENNTGKKNILSYFTREPLIKQENTAKKTYSSLKRKKEKMKNSPEHNQTLQLKKNKSPVKRKINRATLYNNYLYAIDANNRKEYKISECSTPDCDGEKILSNEGCLVCKKCGLSEPVLVTVDKPNYKEPVQDSGIYAYRRINHLNEILSQLQAKESTDIPSRVFESILRELKKRKIDKNDLDIFKLRRILKKLDFRKYYEHVPHILQIINGKEPPNFTRKDELRIKKMFRDIQKPFSIYCPPTRKNFLNYSYVLHKFCELLDLDDYINYFPLLKNNAKLLQHDRIWKNICKYMRWEYYKSI